MHGGDDDSFGDDDGGIDVKDMELFLQESGEGAHPRVQSLSKSIKEEAIKPLELDWREQRAVSRVKRQGRCGACWAITAAGALEGAYAIKYK